MKRKVAIILVSTLLITTSYGFDKNSSCDDHSIGLVLQKHFHRQKIQFEIEHSHCIGEWAVTSGTLGPLSRPDNGPQGAPTSFVLRKRHTWKLIPKAQACGTFEPSKPERYPPDAQVPKPLYQEACLAG